MEFYTKKIGGDTSKLKAMGLRDTLELDGLLSQLVLPITGGGLDRVSETEEDLMYHKRTFFKNTFTHIGQIISNPKIFEIFEKMMTGATCDDGSGEDVIGDIDAYFAGGTKHKHAVELFMFGVEKNTDFFTENGTLQLFMNHIIGLVSTQQE